MWCLVPALLALACLHSSPVSPSPVSPLRCLYRPLGSSPPLGCLKVICLFHVDNVCVLRKCLFCCDYIYTIICMSNQPVLKSTGWQSQHERTAYQSKGVHTHMYNIGVHIVYVSVAMQIKAGPILFSCWYSGTYCWHWRIFHLPVYSSLSLLPLSPVHRCQLHPDPASCCHHTQICTVQTHFDSLAPCERSRVLGQTPTPKFFPTYFNKDAKLKSSKYDGKLWITHRQTH